MQLWDHLACSILWKRVDNDWDHIVLDVPELPVGLNKILEALGQRGWELVNVIPLVTVVDDQNGDRVARDYMAFFKRPVAPARAEEPADAV